MPTSSASPSTAARGIKPLPRRLVIAGLADGEIRSLQMLGEKRFDARPGLG